MTTPCKQHARVASTAKFCTRCGHSLKTAELTLSDSDKKVIDAFTDGKSGESKKLSSDGKRLDGLWSGGNKLAEWKGGKIVLNDVGSKAGQTVHNFIKKNTPKNLLA